MNIPKAGKSASTVVCISPFQVVICSFTMLSSYPCFIKSRQRVFCYPHIHYVFLEPQRKSVFPTELTTAICLAKTPLILLQFMLRFFSPQYYFKKSYEQPACMVHFLCARHCAKSFHTFPCLILFALLGR